VKINHKQKSPCIFLAQQTSPTFSRHEDSIVLGLVLAANPNAVPDAAEEKYEVVYLG
jgi:hypothetical protein